ncbi:MAG: peroxiredoxin family protein [Candidatus Binataceae bacterium]
MTRKVKQISAVAVAIAATGGVLFVLWMFAYPRLRPEIQKQTAPSGAPPISAGQMAGQFTLQDLNGRTVSLKSLRGKVVFLNVWATWCGPCREEMPSIETLYNEFKNNKNFVILAISQDTAGESVVKQYVDSNGYHFEVLLDPQNTVGEEYNVSGVPETFIIDRDGRIVAHHMGAFDWSRADFREALKELLENRAKS